MLAIGCPVPAGAIKPLKDARWRATLLPTLFSQAGKETCFLSELLERRAFAAAQIPPREGGRAERGGSGGQQKAHGDRSLGDT